MLKDYLKSFAKWYAISYLATTALENTQARKAELRRQPTAEDNVRGELAKLGEIIENAMNSQN